MTKPITVYLPQEELRLLLRLSIDDLREPDAQIRWLVISEAMRRGILPANGKASTANVTPQLKVIHT